MRPLKLFIFAAVMTMVSCTPQVLPPPIACKSEDAKCFIDAATKTLSVIYSDINYWETVSFWSAVIATLFGVFGTVMIALQTDTNRKWTKPLAIIGTTAVTGITALTTAFHVPENIDKLIDIY